MPDEVKALLPVLMGLRGAMPDQDAAAAVRGQRANPLHGYTGNSGCFAYQQYTAYASSTPPAPVPMVVLLLAQVVGLFSARATYASCVLSVCIMWCWC